MLARYCKKACIALVSLSWHVYFSKNWLSKPRYAYGIVKFAREPDWRLGAGQRGRTRCGDGVREQRVGRTSAGVHPLYPGWIYVRPVARLGARAIRGRGSASRQPRGVYRGGE